MRFRTLSTAVCLLLGWSCLLAAQSSPAVRTAQQSTRPLEAQRRSASSAQLLNADDGLAILGAALEGRYKTESRSDCSHLVHAIYEKAGFPYKYQSSSDLFAGDEDFRRVTQPQAGDLVVWPGHAGIVVSPAQHTFYSALRSGFGVQPYDSVYWRGRGRPRFLRYVKAAPQPVLASNRTPGLKPTGLHTASDVEAVSTESNRDRSDREPVLDDSASSVSDPVTVPTLPKTVVVYANRLKADQIENALREQFQAFADTLETRDLLALQPSVISFDRLDVHKLQLKGNKGGAQLHFNGAVALAQSNSRSKPRADTQHLDLHRANGGWEVVLPSNAIYLPRETVVRILAHQLAALTDNTQPPQSQSDHQVQLARWLNELLASR
jgi:hypothetical protein